MFCILNIFTRVKGIFTLTIFSYLQNNDAILLQPTMIRVTIKVKQDRPPLLTDFNVMLPKPALLRNTLWGLFSNAPKSLHYLTFFKIQTHFPICNLFLFIPANPLGHPERNICHQLTNNPCTLLIFKSTIAPLF